MHQDPRAQLRLYVPDLDTYESWRPPLAEVVGG
jgi:hypothetical protein